jgi:hypothetical protein
MCQHGTIRFLLDGFSWNLIYDYFSKTRLEYTQPRITGTLHEDLYTFMIKPPSFLLRIKNVLCSVTFWENMPLWDNVLNYRTAGQPTNTTHLHCMLDTYTYKHTVMYVPCIIRCSRNDQHNAQIGTTVLFYIPARTCFGRSLPTSGSFWIRLSYQIDLYFNVIQTDPEASWWWQNAEWRKIPSKKSASVSMHLYIQHTLNIWKMKRYSDGPKIK